MEDWFTDNIRSISVSIVQQHEYRPCREKVNVPALFLHDSNYMWRGEYVR